MKRLVVVTNGAVLTLAIALVGCAVARTNVPYTEAQRHRIVIEAESQRAVPGAIVLFIWARHETDIAMGSRLFCEHAEIMRSDDQGRYTVPTWRDRSPMIVAIYRRGFSRTSDAESRQKGVDTMMPFNGSATERYAELIRISGGLNCDERELRNVKDLYIAMNEEAIALIRTEADAKMADVFQINVDAVLYGGEEARRRDTARAMEREKKGRAR